MSSSGAPLSRDPNLCACCSSLGDGMLDDLVQAAVMKLAADQEAAALARLKEDRQENVLTNRSP